MSKRFALKRFMGLTTEEIAENELMWKEENGLSKENMTAAAELRSAGITGSSTGQEMDAMGQAGEPDPNMPGMDASGQDAGAAPPV
jgi:hypothetical protein